MAADYTLFVLAAYLVPAIALGTLSLWIALDARAVRRDLARLDAARRPDGRA